MLHGTWYDGRSSRGQAVAITLRPAPRGPDLELARLDGAAAPLVVAHRDVGWPEDWSMRRAPPKVVVDLGAAGSLEVTDVAGWRAALAAAGRRAPIAQRMQTRLSVFLAVAVLAVAALAGFYRWGTPWAATQITRQVPLTWEANLAQRALSDLDARWLHPSRLPPARQQQLRERFEALARQVEPSLRRYPGYAPPLELQFRRGMGANAFALPGGVIVLTDGMVAAAARAGLPDEALLGVLAHEIGHVLHRHTTRMVVEQGVLNVGLGLALGDVSMLLSVGGSLLTGLAYRRGHEAEADCFALALLRRADLPAAPMARLLLAVEGEARGRAGGDAGGGWGLLSTHPGTPQRARDLEDGRIAGCG